MRKHRAPLVLAIALMSAFALAATASAAPTPKVTGGVELSSPMQYFAFNAFDYGTSADDKGTVEYTNFTAPAPGTDVWNVLGTYPIVFSFGGDYTHSATVTTIDPISPTATRFWGTGYYVAGPETTWTIEGVVDGSAIWFDLVYTAGPYIPYSLHATGTINPDGSMSGSSLDTYVPQRTLPWSVPAGSVHEVFNYTASVDCAKVAGATAQFSYVIPADAPLAAGVPVLWAVTDGGSPGAGNDTVGFTTSFVSCDTPTGVGAYPIVGGNLVVH